MKLVVLITSTILPELDAPLDTGSVRSAFIGSERLIQTVASLHSIQIQLPHAQVVLCDGSKPNYGEWFSTVFPELTYLHLESYDPAIAQTIRTCGNKSLGECHLMLGCWHICRDLIQNADFVLKLSGRYMVEHVKPEQFSTFPPDAYLFPPERPDDVRPWVDDRGFDWSLARNPEHPTEHRHLLRTVFYGWGQTQTEAHFERIKQILFDLHRPEYQGYDIENLLSRELAGHRPLRRPPWHYLGWNGVTGDFIRL